MKQSTRDRMARVIAKQFTKLKGLDAITFAERLGDVLEPILDMEMEESGIGNIPPAVAEAMVDFDDDVRGPESGRPRLDIPPAARAVAPAPREGSKIIMPGDPGFDDQKPKDLPRKRISALDVRRTTITRPGANVPEKQWWAESDLMAVILENTEERITFDAMTPSGQVMPLPAVRNVHNQQGMGSVVLTYRHPQVSEQVDGNTTVDLIAKFPFSVYDEHVDIENAMHGPKGIMIQLQGAYKPRPERMDPVAGPAPPQLSERLLRNNDGSLRSDPGGMNGELQVGGDYDNEGRLRDPGQQDYMGTVRQRNDSIVPMHTRLQKR